MKHLLVCLGTPLNDGQLPELLVNRLDDVLQQSSNDPAATILLIGSRTPGDDPEGLTAAEAMRRYLVEHRAELEFKIIIEDQTTNTVEELCLLRQLIDTGAIMFDGAQRITLVSSQFFIERVKLYVEYIFGSTTGFEFIASPVPFAERGDFEQAETAALRHAEGWLANIEKGNYEAVRNAQPVAAA